MKLWSEFAYRIFLLVGLSAVLGCSCLWSVSSSTRTEPPSPLDSIPPIVLDESLRFIASLVGEEFCRENIRFDRRCSQAHPRLPARPVDFAQLHPNLASSPRFRMCYHLRVAESPWVDGRIEFLVDAMGRVLPDTRVDGIPDCVHNPMECTFPIDKAEAFRLAKEAGLEEGLRPWEAAFHWMADSLENSVSGTYVWRVSNTRHASAHRKGGDTILIDANSGEAVPHGRMGWETISDGP
jgi:hypothetical protein